MDIAGCLHSLTGSVADHKSILPGFEPRPGYVRRLFHLSLYLISFGGQSVHLAYLVHKSGNKTATFTFLHGYCC